MTKLFPRFAVALAVVTLMSACAMSLRNPNIADLRANPGRYQDRTVSVDGVVTTSWGTPFMPVHFYKVDDGTGEVTVVSQQPRVPTRGARVRVKGVVNELAVLGGEAVGLHLEERALYVKR